MQQTIKKHHKLITIASLASTVAAQSTFAHIGYSGRDFGVLEIGAPASTISISNVSSSFGWADATDETWGDSHRGRFFRFTLDQTASVTITVERNNLGTGAADTFLPAFSVFEGLGHLAPYRASHDGSALSVASRPDGTKGSLRTLTDWSIGNDPTYNVQGDPTSGILHEASLVHFTYIGHAADGTPANFGDVEGILGDGVADGWVMGTFHNLNPGDYSIFVGGANIHARDIETRPFPTYGVDVTMAAIPEPSTYAIGMGLAVLGILLVRRRLHRQS